MAVAMFSCLPCTRMTALLLPSLGMYQPAISRPSLRARKRSHCHTVLRALLQFRANQARLCIDDAGRRKRYNDRHLLGWELLGARSSINLRGLGITTPQQLAKAAKNRYTFFND